jgi:hypothetical protein
MLSLNQYATEIALFLKKKLISNIGVRMTAISHFSSAQRQASPPKEGGLEPEAVLGPD